MPIRWTVPRVVAVVVSLALTGFAALSLGSAWGAWKDFKAAEQAEPAGGAIDLSTRGSFTFPLAHTYPAAHGVELNVLLVDGQTAERALAGISARLEVIPEAGAKPIRTLDYPGAYSPDPARPELARLFYVTGLARGDYLLRLTIDQGAPALAGTAQTIRGDYLLCGLEAMTAVILAAIGAGGLLLALLITGLTFRYSRPRLAQPPSTARPPSA